MYCLTVWDNSGVSPSSVPEIFPSNEKPCWCPDSAERGGPMISLPSSVLSKHDWHGADSNASLRRRSINTSCYHDATSFQQHRLSVLNTVASGLRVYPIITCSCLPLPLCLKLRLLLIHSSKEGIFFIYFLHACPSYTKDTSSSCYFHEVYKSLLERFWNCLGSCEEFCVKFTHMTCAC